MPRKRDRFNRLKQSLRDSGATPTPNSRADNYLKWLTGTNKITMTRKPSSAMRERFNVGVIPFGVSPDTGAGAQNFYKTTITMQAHVIKEGISGLTDNDLGLTADISATQEALGVFYPALVRVFVTAVNATSDSETSGITKESYKRTKGRSGSIPFGRTITSTEDAKKGTAETAIADVDEQDVKESLKGKLLRKAVGTGMIVRGISFVSEVWRDKPTDNKELPSSDLPDLTI